MIFCLFAYPAHVPVDNIGEFFAGILHPFLVPAHVLAIVISGLLASRIPRRSLAISRIFMVALFLGLLASGLGMRLPVTLLLLIALLLSGGFVAADPHRFKTAGAFALVAVTGCLLGLDSVFEDLTGGDLWWCLAGCLVGAGFASFYLSKLAKLANKKWQHIAIRIAASWIATVGLLMIALKLAA